MTRPESNTAIQIGFLAEIRLSNGGQLRYQNFNPLELFLWNDRYYTFLPFEVPDIPESMEGDTTRLTAVLPNLPPIDGYVANNLLRKGRIDIYMLFRNGDEDFHKKYGLSIISTAVAVDAEGQNERIELTLEPRESAVSGTIPNLYYKTGSGNGNPNLKGLVPALPRSTFIGVN